MNSSLHTTRFGPTPPADMEARVAAAYGKLEQRRDATKDMPSVILINGEAFLKPEDDTPVYVSEKHEAYTYDEYGNRKILQLTSLGPTSEFLKDAVHMGCGLYYIPKPELAKGDGVMTDLEQEGGIRVSETATGVKIVNQARQELDELTRRLHEAERHPDYEYQSREWPRKYGTSSPPEGNGWEENFDKDGGYTRYDNTEDHHWRRHKSCKLADEPDVWRLPKIELNKIKHDEYFKFVNDALGAREPREWRSMLYIEGIEGSDEGDWLTGFYKTDKTATHFFVFLDRHVAVITDLRLAVSSYRMRLGNGSWGKIHEWGDRVPLPIDLLQLMSRCSEIATSYNTPVISPVTPS